MPRLPIGWKVWYGDGSIVDSKGRTWEGAPGTDVQFVCLFWDETYQITIQDGYDEHGNPINQRTVTENYVTQLHSADYYWLEFDGSGQIVLRCGAQSDVPANVPAGRVKRGRSMQQSAWDSLYNQAKEQRRWT